MSNNLRIDKKTTKVVEESILGDTKKKQVYYVISFKDGLLHDRRYLKLEVVGLRCKYCSFHFAVFATRYNTREDAEYVLKQIYEHPEIFDSDYE